VCLESDFGAVLREVVGNVGKHFGGEAAGLGEVLTELAGEVDEGNAFDRTGVQVMEDCLGRKMRNFANEKVEWFGEERSEVFGFAKVGTVSNATISGFKKKTIGGEIGRILFLEASAQPIQMGGAERGDADIGDTHRRFWAQWDQAQAELEQFVEDQNGLQHFAQWFDGAPWQIDGQCFAAFFEPESLHEHEEAADMIGVEVGNEHSVNGVVAQAGSFVVAVNGFSAINEDPGSAEAVEKGGVIAVWGGGAVAGAETGH
jgi:hypothetical protein